MKTPLRYPGGKSKVAEYLVSLFPEYKEYREPFLGGGSVFLEATEKNPDAVYVINDMYYDLYCFWRCMILQPNDVINGVVSLKERFDSGRELYESVLVSIETDRLNQISLSTAVDFFVLNRITFSGTSLSGGYSEESFRKRFTDSSIKRLEDLGRFLETRNVALFNEDYSFIMNIDGDTDSTFAFLDPPYYSAENSKLYGHNGNLHRGFEHSRLKECLDGCKYKWMMTYDDCDYIRDLYKDYNVKELELMYGMRNTGNNPDMKGKELIISNYDLKEGNSVVLF